ncbi:hypothetical protein MPDQ_003898 [Monascus purpureus]|uniref:alkaline phosphatase n=1 Tax=Monascus purpureus TaxID=5098 RepID=A0A507QM40_MONPU|nr:hypothetical protein MPDQ_003898 [Monascus purpureus]
MRIPLIFAVACFVAGASAQTFQRLGGCPDLGCVFPPDQAEFLPGQYFDIRLEVHSPVNGSEAREGEPDPDFKLSIVKKGRRPIPAAKFFDTEEPPLETWDFTWYEDLFAKDADKPSLVKVTSKAYRKVALYDPGEYKAILTYWDKQTVANWVVRDIPHRRRAKNVVLFIGDGMTTNMITAARLIAHKSINGKYLTKMALDKFPVLGHQMTHSMDSFITDSANSATALYSGHKTTVNALNVYVDSSSDPFDDPKFETITEILRRTYPGSGVGIVSTAFLADATPAALVAHTSNRGEYDHVISAYLEGPKNTSWTSWDGPDVLLGAGAEAFLQTEDAPRDYYRLFAENGYTVVWNNTALDKAPNDQRLLGVFQKSNLATWLDRNVYRDNLLNRSNYPDGSGRDAEDLPGLREMTLKAIDVLHERHGKKGWFLMSEAASIDKQMHTLDYDRSLGELLELDDTVRATIDRLRELGELEDTLLIVTADHGHGFDVTGSIDTEYLNAQTDDRSRRKAVGYYENSGLSQYTVGGPNSLRYSEGVHFPARWDPRYTLHSGVVAFPDHRENYQVHSEGPRTPAVSHGNGQDGYYANYKDAVTGFLINGTLPVDSSQGVHSLTDVPVFAQGPCQELFGGVYNSIDIFFSMAECLGLSGTRPWI